MTTLENESLGESIPRTVVGAPLAAPAFKGVAMKLARDGRGMPRAERVEA